MAALWPWLFSICHKSLPQNRIQVTDPKKGDGFHVKQRQGQVPNATGGRGCLKEIRDKNTLLIWDVMDGLLERRIGRAIGTEMRLWVFKVWWIKESFKRKARNNKMIRKSHAGFPGGNWECYMQVRVESSPGWVKRQNRTTLYKQGNRNSQFMRNKNSKNVF